MSDPLDRRDEEPISEAGELLVQPSPAGYEQAALPQRQLEQLGESSLKEVIESYLRYYAAGDGHTSRAKRYDLSYFLEYLASGAALESVRVSDWTMQSTKDYMDARLALGEAPATVSRRLATVKHLGRTLAERIHGFINPAREVKGPTLSITKPKGLSADEITLLRNAALQSLEESNDSFNALRNRFLLELLLATGLRADEVRLLYYSQVSEELDWLRNVKTKGRKFRNVYLDSETQNLFAEYLSAREEELEKKLPLFSSCSPQERGRLPVFVSFYRAQLDKPASLGLSSKTVWRIIANFGRLAQGLSEEKLSSLHPHMLRHTFAHGLLDSSKDVRLVAQALGHSDVRTTMRYTERTEEQVAKAIEKKLAEGK